MTSNIQSRNKASFPVRRMDYQFEKMTRYWFDNEPAFTHFFTGLSTLFPEGESFFVRSVRALRSKIDPDSQLNKEIGAFIGQEAMHSKEHHAFHLSAQQYGLDPESLERATGILLKTVEKISTKKLNLSITVGLEHITALMVVNMMHDIHEFINDETIRNLWLWHSVEESEHKAVAFDMYQTLYGTGLSAYIPRVTMFSMALGMLILVSHSYQVVLMKRDKQLLNITSWLKYAKFTKNQFKIFIPKFLDYYRIDFHPNDSDETELVAETKIKIGLVHAPDTLLI